MQPTQLLSLVLGDLRFGIDVRRVEEVLAAVPLTPVPLADPRVVGLLHRRSQVVTAVDLRRRLELPPAPVTAPAMHVVVRADGVPTSLVVDGVEGVIDVAGVPRSAPPSTVPAHIRTLVAAVHALPDVLLLELDVDRVLDLHTDAPTRAAS